MRKILVIQTAFLGDAILTLPMIQKLKEKNPGSRIHVLAIPATEEIFSSSPSVDKILIMDKKKKDRTVFALIRFIRKIKSEHYDAIYSPHRSLRSALIVMGSGTKETYGFSNSSLKHVYNNLVVYEPKHHEVRRNLELIGYSKNDGDWRIRPEIKTGEETAEKIDEFLSGKDINSKIAAIAPGSVWNTKIYPEKYFGDIVDFLNNKGFHTIIIGGKADEKLCTRIHENYKENSTPAAGIFSIPETVELLKRTRILITNDSAPAHMGTCAAIPVLTLYCSTVPDFGFYPYNVKSSYLSYDDLSCKPCGIHGYNECPVKTFECAFNLKPHLVTKKIEEMLNDKI